MGGGDVQPRLMFGDAPGRNPTPILRGLAYMPYYMQCTTSESK